MNLAYYVLIFDHATDEFHGSIGLGRAYRERANNSTFAVEAHVTYDAELKAGAEVVCRTWLLGHDDKRIHYFHTMHHASEGFLAATTELLGFHVDLSVRRVAPMPADIQARLAALRERQAALPRPKQVGRVIGIKPRDRG
jgi:acyl-CoA thioester hydrolase